MHETKPLRHWLGLLFSILLLIGCSSDDPSGPTVTGSPPDFLTGEWLVRDSVTNCKMALDRFLPTHVYTDTICASTLDFTEASVQTVWLMYLSEIGACSFNYLPLETRSSSGVISDTLINILWEGAVQHYLYGEDCYIDLTVSIRGLPQDDSWILLRSLEWLEDGYECGYNPWQSEYNCYSFMSVMERIGDVENACSEDASASISGKFYQELDRRCGR